MFKLKNILGFGIPNLVVKAIRGAVMEMFNIERDRLNSALEVRHRYIKDEVTDAVKEEIDRLKFEFREDKKKIDSAIDAVATMKDEAWATFENSTNDNIKKKAARPKKKNK